jgi:transcriptional regulator with XRE-family HTH domain
LPEIDPKKVRERFGISQAEFAARFCLELDTIQNWEQGRYRPDPTAQLLLKLIQDYPALIEAVVTGTVWPGMTIFQTEKHVPLGASFQEIVKPWIVSEKSVRIGKT